KKLVPWHNCNADKTALKLHVGLDHERMIPEYVIISDGKEVNLINGRNFDFAKGNNVACDMRYVDYGWYKSLTDKGVFFVTRLRPNSIYTVLERRDVIPGQGVTSDQVIQLNSAHALRRGAPRLRRVGFRYPEDRKSTRLNSSHVKISY